MIYIHIGLKKTGSTTIQRFLARNAHILKERGVLYPQLGGLPGHAHHHMAVEIIAGSKEGRAAWDELLKLAQIGAAEHLLISAESFEQSDPREVKRLLAGHTATVLCYVRDTASSTRSRYTQATKYGHNVRDIDAYFEHRQGVRRLKFAPLLKKWADALGPERIRVRSLDRSVLQGGDLVADFLSALGLGAEGFIPPPESEAKLNRAPGWKTVELLRAVHAEVQLVRGRPARNVVWPAPTHMQIGDIGLAVGSEQGLDDDAGTYLSASQLEICAQIYAEDIEQTQALGIDARLAALDPERQKPRSFKPTASEVPADEAAEFYRLAFTRLAVLTPRPEAIATSPSSASRKARRNPESALPTAAQGLF